MSDTIKVKDASPLVKTVIALDSYLSELERVGAKINSMTMKTDFDFEQARRLMARFAECGQGVSEEVTNLSMQLNEARARASQVAEGVEQRSQMLSSRNTDEQEKLEQFRALGEKVRDFNIAVSALRQPEGKTLTDEDRAKVARGLADFEAQLDPLIEEAQTLRNGARSSKMKELERNAESLAQTLIAVRAKIRGLGMQ